MFSASNELCQGSVVGHQPGFEFFVDANQRHPLRIHPGLFHGGKYFFPVFFQAGSGVTPGRMKIPDDNYFFAVFQQKPCCLSAVFYQLFFVIQGSCSNVDAAIEYFYKPTAYHFIRSLGTAFEDEPDPAAHGQSPSRVSLPMV
jgi:hypothetical protein